MRIELLLSAGAMLGALSMTGITLLPRVAWMEADLVVPKSFRPFSHNGTHVGLESVWSTSQVSLRIHVHGEQFYQFPIEDFSENLAQVVAAARLDPRLIVLAEDIARYCRFFRSSSFIGCALSLCGILLLLLRSLYEDNSNHHRAKAWRRQSHRGQQGSGFTLTYWVESTRFEILRLLPFLLVIAGTLLSLGSGALYGYTVFEDAKVLMPSLVKNLQLLCLTHGAGACREEQHVRLGALVFASAHFLQLVLCFTLGLCTHLARGDESLVVEELLVAHPAKEDDDDDDDILTGCCKTIRGDECNRLATTLFKCNHQASYS